MLSVILYDHYMNQLEDFPKASFGEINSQQLDCVLFNYFKLKMSTRKSINVRNVTT